jgi:hypothetical protein
MLLAILGQPNKVAGYVNGITFTTKCFLTILGQPNTVADYMNGMKFTTTDRDQDRRGGNCAADGGGGWWFNGCAYVNMNGAYGYVTSYATGIYWSPWHGHSYSLKATEMKIKPVM